MPADGERFDCGDDGFFESLAAELVRGRFVRKCQSAIQLVDVAEVANEVPKERNSAVIEVREIDARPKHTTAFVFWMLDHTAAQYNNFNRSIEQCEVDASLHAGKRGLVLSVEKSRIVKRQNCRTFAPLDRCTWKSRLPFLEEFWKQMNRFIAWQQHRVTEMAACLLTLQNRRNEQPLINLQPCLLALPKAIFRSDILRRRHQTREGLRGRRQQVLQPNEARPFGGQHIIDCIDVSAQKQLARFARETRIIRPARSTLSSWPVDGSCASKRDVFCQYAPNALRSATKLLVVRGAAFCQAFTSRAGSPDALISSA